MKFENSKVLKDQTWEKNNIMAQFRFQELQEQELRVIVDQINSTLVLEMANQLPGYVPSQNDFVKPATPARLTYSS